MQSIALLEQMDKDINTFCMRLKEWFAWHFPEMTKIVNDNHIYSKIVCLCAGDREFLTMDENKEALDGVTHDETKSQQIIDAARISMGMEMSESDALQVTKWGQRVEALIAFRESLVEYLQARMTAVAPNLQALIGEQLGAKLITHAGGLTNLSKYPASTIQILGAEKALFRALKTKGATPKYGLIFNSTFIGRAGTKNKGKISRYLANKLAIASRVDCFSENPTDKFGIGLKGQVEERLKFLASGGKPRKNKEAMAEVIDELKSEGLFYGDKVRVKKEEGDDEAEQVTDDEPKKAKKDKKEKKEKKEKKDKKRKHESSDSEDEVVEPKKKRAKK